MGDLYDYPRENIERRKLIRQLRRVVLQSGLSLPDEMEIGSRQVDAYGSLVDLEAELTRFEDIPRKTGA